MSAEIRARIDVRRAISAVIDVDDDAKSRVAKAIENRLHQAAKGDVDREKQLSEAFVSRVKIEGVTTDEAALLKLVGEVIEGNQQKKQKKAENDQVSGWSVDRVVKWLTDNGLGEYALRFREEGVDGQVLIGLTDEELRELGVVKMGPRKKITNLQAQREKPAVKRYIPPAEASTSQKPVEKVLPTKSVPASRDMVTKQPKVYEPFQSVGGMLSYLKKKVEIGDVKKLMDGILYFPDPLEDLLGRRELKSAVIQ